MPRPACSTSCCGSIQLAAARPCSNLGFLRGTPQPHAVVCRYAWPSGVEETLEAKGSTEPSTHQPASWCVRPRSPGLGEYGQVSRPGVGARLPISAPPTPVLATCPHVATHCKQVAISSKRVTYGRAEAVTTGSTAQTPAASATSQQVGSSVATRPRQDSVCCPERATRHGSRP